MNVLDISTPSNTKLKREGKITKIDFKKEKIYIKYASYDLITELRFYGGTWGLV